MTDTQVLAAVAKLSGEPAGRWLGYRRTLDGANVVTSSGQKHSYTHDQLRAALQLTLDEALQRAAHPGGQVKQKPLTARATPKTRRHTHSK